MIRHLTDEEVRERAQALADELHKLQVLEEAAKQSASEWRKRLNGVRMAVRTLGDEVRTRTAQPVQAELFGEGGEGGEP